jgi:putative copper export protein
MLSIDVNVIRLTLHILAATIWVGGMIVLGALTGPLRRAAPEALAPAARAFAWVAWPAFAVLIVTGIWNLVAGGPVSNAYQATLMVKMVLVVLSGLGAALHTFAKNPTLKGIWGAVALLGALGAVLLGVAMVEAP